LFIRECLRALAFFVKSDEGRLIVTGLLSATGLEQITSITPEWVVDFQF
jgi:hypothetical protein